MRYSGPIAVDVPPAPATRDLHVCEIIHDNKITACRMICLGMQKPQEFLVTRDVNIADERCSKQPHASTVVALRR